MANIFIDPVIVMTPFDNESREGIEVWLANLNIWLEAGTQQLTRASDNASAWRITITPDGAGSRMHYTQAAHEAGLKSGEGVGKLVKRFNEHGLAALSIAAGAGHKPTYTSKQQARILQEVQRPPDRREDGTANWSLSTLQQALRKTDLPDIARETIRQVLHEAGYSFQQTRTWCRTGYALRKRKSGSVTTYDEQTSEKKD